MGGGAVAAAGASLLEGKGGKPRAVRGGLTAVGDHGR